jgi:hypothetical protein
MPEGGQVEAALGVAIAKMQLAQLAALEVFECMFPHMIRDKERSEWLQKLTGAHLALEIADYQLSKAGAMIHPDGARYPRTLTKALAEFEASGSGSQDQLHAAAPKLLGALDAIVGNWYATAECPNKPLLIEQAEKAIVQAGGDVSKWTKGPGV